MTPERAREIADPLMGRDDISAAELAELVLRAAAEERAWWTELVCRSCGQHHDERQRMLDVPTPLPYGCISPPITRAEYERSRR